MSGSVATLDNRDHFAALDQDIWGDEPGEGSPDPAADVMQSMRELAQLMGQTVNMVQEAVASLNERFDKIESMMMQAQKMEAHEQPQPQQ